MTDFYFGLGKLYFRRQATPVRDDPADLDSTTTNESIEHAFFLMLTASSLGHKQARAYFSIMMENGFIPSTQVFSEMTKSGARYEYLNLLLSPKEIGSFKKDSNYTMQEYKQEFFSKSLINLYLSSMTDLSSNQKLMSLDAQ